MESLQHSQTVRASMAAWLIARENKKSFSQKVTSHFKVNLHSQRCCLKYFVHLAPLFKVTVQSFPTTTALPATTALPSIPKLIATLARLPMTIPQSEKIKYHPPPIQTQLPDHLLPIYPPTVPPAAFPVSPHSIHTAALSIPS